MLTAAIELFSKKGYHNVSIVRLYFAETRGASFNIKAGLEEPEQHPYPDDPDVILNILGKGLVAAR
jgi:hypothetical protein